MMCIKNIHVYFSVSEYIYCKLSPGALFVFLLRIFSPTAVLTFLWENENIPQRFAGVK